MIIDARHKNCPIPVIMANKEIEKKIKSFSIQVDNAIAVENLKKLADNKEYDLEIKQNQSDYTVVFSSNTISDQTANNFSPPDDTESSDLIGDWVLFIGKETIGDGDPLFGESLMKMYFYTLSQGNTLPKAILFMNNGVKLPTNNTQIIQHLTVLSKLGCEILVCGACLDFYQLTKKLKIGSISNMYAISEEINAAAKVVSF